MSSIQAVLRDAEKQQSTSESIKNWLGKLQDVMYDMDDLLDDITTEFKIKDKNKGQWRKQVRKFFSRTNCVVLRWEWAHRIKSLCKKLDQIAIEKNSFVLSTESLDFYSLEPGPRETHSMVGKSELILGRDEDKEAIINSILNCGDREDLSVLSVVGFGAIGKTTLARLVYNDNRIDDNFDQKLWVYVSEKYSIKRVLKQVISMATRESILQLSMEQLSLEQLRIKTSEALQGKKYFLVLDDLWNKDSNEWKRLRELLNVGAKGSTVLVTTCESDVASIVQSVDEYRLRELSTDTCLEIVQRLAFKEGEEVEPKLWIWQKEIVDKSKGLPLLVNTLGNLLRGQKDEKEWHTIIHKLEQGHDDILKMLKLSYDQLPSYMKLCFRTLSIYDKGEQLYKFYMLHVWMALGFLLDDEGRESLGSKCVMELLSKSLLTKDGPTAEVDLGYFQDHCMHDFVHDLAESLAGEELVIINNSTKEVFEKVRYVALDDGVSIGKSRLERLLNQAKKARLLKINRQSPNKAFLETTISRFKFLRMLDLRGCQFL